MPSRVGSCGLVVVVAASVFFLNLGGARLWDRDEPRNAGCAREMLLRNDWVTPIFNAELRTHKPVLLYWFMMSAYAMLGVSEFSARAWSAALAVGTTLCTYAIGRRLFSLRVGTWAGVILASNLMFAVAGRAATPDSVLIFFSTLALTVYVLAVIPQDGIPRAPLRGEHEVGFANSDLGSRYAWLVPDSWPTYAAIYAAMGLGVLAKGPVGLVLPTAVIGMFLLIMRLPERSAVPGRQTWPRSLVGVLRPFEPIHFFRTCWSLRPLTALFLVLAIAMPWYVWVGVRTDGQFLRGFFLEHHFGRATQVMEGHRGSLLFYPAAILVGFFPWSVFAVPAISEAAARLRRRDAATAGYVFAGCWAGVYLGLFSLARTKLPSYVTPCYPALALVTGALLDRFAQGSLLAGRHWIRLALATYAAVGLIATCALSLVLNRFLPGEGWLALLGLVPLLAGVWCLWRMQRGDLSGSSFTFAGSAVILVLLVFGLASARVDRHQENHRLVAVIQRHGPGAEVGAYGCLEPSWVFYSGRPIREISLDASSPTSVGTDWITKTRVTLPEFLSATRQPLVITNDDHLSQLRLSLPADFRVLAEASHFLRAGRFYLLGRQPQDSHLARECGPPTGRR